MDYKEAGLSAFDRLRWLVLRRFGILPGSSSERGMKPEDFIFAGINMVLDVGAAARKDTPAPSVNPSFDEARFLSMKGALTRES